MSTIVPGPATFATKGSQRWLQIAVNRRPEVLNEPIRAAMGLPAETGIEWLSPLQAENFVEYRDGATYKQLNCKLKPEAAEFWPAGGPVWDGLARLSNSDVLLVEAKAHVPEMISGGTRATEPARTKIAESLARARRVLAPRAEVDWTGTFYQYANRMAHLYFLREEKQRSRAPGVPLRPQRERRERPVGARRVGGCHQGR